MHIDDAQRELRTVYLRTFPGSLVCATIWLVSAALGTWSSPRAAIWTLTLGGMFIFPLTLLLLKAMGRRASLQHGNPMGQLATQIAFTVPLSLPLIGAATIHHLYWFYPAFMIVIGAHYLPFIFLYGMWEFAVLGGVLIWAGLAFGMGWVGAHSFTAGGWFTVIVFVIWAIIMMIRARADERAAAASAR